MWIRIILPLILVPLVDLALLARIARSTSVLAMMALVVTDGVIGVWLIRRQGRRALRSIESDPSLGATPSKGMMDAPLLIAAGLLLIFPGVLTDVAALILMIPATRRRLGARLTGVFRSRIMYFGSSGFVDDRDMVDAEVVTSGGSATTCATDSRDAMNRMIGP